MNLLDALIRIDFLMFLVLVSIPSWQMKKPIEGERIETPDLPYYETKTGTRLYCIQGGATSERGEGAA